MAAKKATAKGVLSALTVRRELQFARVSQAAALKTCTMDFRRG